MYVSGSTAQASGVIVSGGTEFVSAGGTLINGVVEAGGSEIVSAAPTAAARSAPTAS